MRVSITLLERMLGTVPKDREVYKTYVESRKPANHEEEESENVAQIEEKGWTGFLEDENGLFVYDYFIKGFLKHAANVLKDVLKVKALRSKLNDFVFVMPRKIYFGKKLPDGVIERPLRAMTVQGPRVSLARSDYIEAGTQFEFEICLYPPHPEIKPGTIRSLLDYGRFMGLGQFRNGGYGRFSYEITE